MGLNNYRIAQTNFGVASKVLMTIFKPSLRAQRWARQSSWTATAKRFAASR
jgi:hypothetical protein